MIPFVQIRGDIAGSLILRAHRTSLRTDRESSKDVSSLWADWQSTHFKSVQ